MDKIVSDWNQTVVDTFQNGCEKNIDATSMVGTYMGCVVVAARKDGATLDNMIQLLKKCWNQEINV